MCQNCDTGLQSRCWPGCGPLYRLQEYQALLPASEESTYTQWLRPHPESRVTQFLHRLLKSGLCIDRGWSSSLMARNRRMVFVFHSCIVSGLIILGKGMTPRLGAPWNRSALMWLLWLLQCDLWLKGSSWPQKLSSVLTGTGKSRHSPLGEHTPRDPPPLNRLTFSIPSLPQ